MAIECPCLSFVIVVVADCVADDRHRHVHGELNWNPFHSNTEIRHSEHCNSPRLSIDCGLSFVRLIESNAI